MEGSDNNFQVQVSEELTTGDATEPHVWKQELVRALQLPLGRCLVLKLREERWLSFISVDTAWAAIRWKKQGWA